MLVKVRSKVIYFITNINLLELGSICEIKASVTPLNVDFKVLGKAGKSVEHTRQIALQFIEAYAEKLDVIFPDPKEKTIITHYKPVSFRYIYWV